MRRLSKPNLESAELVPDVEPLELLDSENEGTVLVNEGIALEQAYNNLNNVICAGVALESSGIAPEIVQSTLGAVAICDIGAVDESMAEETTVALEDDASTFWDTVKKKAVEIWEAIKKYVVRFWDWIKSFSLKAKGNLVVVNKQIDAEMEAIKTLVESVTDSAPESDSGLTEADLKNIEIEATTTWAMNEEGWKVSDLLPRMKHYSVEVVKHAANTAKQMNEITGLSKFYLKQIKTSSTMTSPHEIIAAWEEKAEIAKSNYIGESKFIEGIPILIGFSRIGGGGYKPCKTAKGMVVFKNVGEITEFSAMLKLYGHSSVEAIGELAKADKVIDDLMKTAEDFMRGLDGLRKDVDEATIKKVMPLMRSVMFRHVEMVKEYTSSHGFRSQANGVKLLRAVRLQLVAAGK